MISKNVLYICYTIKTFTFDLHKKKEIMNQNEEALQTFLKIDTYYTNNPEIHNQLMAMSSPSPNFATNQDVCNEMQANGCCETQNMTNTGGGTGGSGISISS